MAGGWEPDGIAVEDPTGNEVAVASVLVLIGPDEVPLGREEA